MTDEQNKILARVRKMLNLANNAGATEGERDNALRMAHATLAKYNLEMAQIAETDPKASADAAEPRVTQESKFFGRPWARAVAVAAGDLCFCSYLYVSATKGKDTKHIFVGRYSNAVTAAELSQYLVESILKEARRMARTAGMGNTYVRSFSWGAASAIRKRVAAIRREAEAPKAVPVPGMSLVAYVHDEAKANAAFMAVAFPKLGKGRQGKGSADSIAMLHGAAFGEKVSLQRQIS